MAERARRRWQALPLHKVLMGVIPCEPLLSWHVRALCTVGA